MSTSTVLMWTWVASLVLSIVMLVLSVALAGKNESETLAKFQTLTMLLTPIFITVFIFTLIAWLVVRHQDAKTTQPPVDAQ